jgi:hypothetical protein
MEYNQDKVDEVVLALMCLTMHDNFGATRAWKGFDWDVLDRLYEKGWIDNPKSKAKSVALTEEGLARANEFFDKHFSMQER